MIEHSDPPNEPRKFWRLTAVIAIVLVIILVAFWVIERRTSLGGATPTGPFPH